MTGPAAWWSPLLRDDDLYFFDWRDRKQHRDAVKHHHDPRYTRGLSTRRSDAVTLLILPWNTEEEK